MRSINITKGERLSKSTKTLRPCFLSYEEGLLGDADAEDFCIISFN